ncbi:MULTISPECIES: hypothetical protein [unclassified Microcoleus]|uniref:hypothetical protein n=1 Tax=unclassified Microcoleus TaxID=2642155 RepID=UPI002FD46992
MSIADTKKKNHQIFFPFPQSTYLEGRIHKNLIPEPLSSYLTNQQFRSAAAYIERSRATTASVYCYFGGISPLLN